jgi:putative ABC transport system ATP-binding protein
MEILTDINQSGTTMLFVTHDVKIAAQTERILYMADGSIVGEKQLGKYNKQSKDLQAREEILTRWLAKKKRAGVFS